MNELLALAIDGHGGLRRWHEVSRFRAEASISGALWVLKSRPGLLADVVLEGETRAQRLTITPFPWPGRYATWEPHRQTIETDDGLLVAERRDPAPPVLGPTRRSAWDDLQVAAFASAANWNYFVAPFLFARPDFAVREAERWREDGERWRRLVVTYPTSIVAHSTQQTHCVDDEGLFRRLDYSIDVLAGEPAVHYPSGYRPVDGIMVPTRRCVYGRTSDGAPVRDDVLMEIEITGVTFS